MSAIKTIRDRLGVTQAVLAEGMGCTQGNVGHYERGQTVPPDAAKRLIAYAANMGYVVTYEDIYGMPMQRLVAAEPRLTPDKSHGTANGKRRKPAATERKQPKPTDKPSTHKGR